MNSDAPTTAIQAYFAGERQEGFAHGATSRTRWIRAFYAVIGPVCPVLDALAPRWVTTTVRVGRAKLAVALNGAPTAVLENREIERLGRAALPSCRD